MITHKTKPGRRLNFRYGTTRSFLLFNFVVKCDKLNAFNLILNCLIEMIKSVPLRMLI